MAGLGAASRWVQETRAAERLLATIGRVDRIPGALRALTRLPVCMSTAVASSIGNVTRRMRADVPLRDGCLAPGGVLVERFAGVPPIRPGTALAAAMMSYANAVTITVMAGSGRPRRAC